MSTEGGWSLFASSSKVLVLRTKGKKMKFVYTYVEFDFSMDDDPDYAPFVETIAKAYNELMGEVFEIENDLLVDDDGIVDPECDDVVDAIVNLISDVTGWLVIDSKWKILEV
jgi:hypothetical protein